MNVQKVHAVMYAASWIVYWQLAVMWISPCYRPFSPDIMASTPASTAGLISRPVYYLQHLMNKQLRKVTQAKHQALTFVFASQVW